MGTTNRQQPADAVVPIAVSDCQLHCFVMPFFKKPPNSQIKDG